MLKSSCTPARFFSKGGDWIKGEEIETLVERSLCYDSDLTTNSNVAFLAVNCLGLPNPFILIPEISVNCLDGKMAGHCTSYVA